MSKDSKRATLQNIVKPASEISIKSTPTINDLPHEINSTKPHLSFFNPRRSFADGSNLTDHLLNKQRKASVSLSNILLSSLDSPSSRVNTLKKTTSEAPQPKRRESKMEEISEKLLNMERGHKGNKKKDLIDMRNKDVDSLSHAQLLEVYIYKQ